MQELRLNTSYKIECTECNTETSQQTWTINTCVPCNRFLITIVKQNNVFLFKLDKNHSLGLEEAIETDNIDDFNDQLVDLNLSPMTRKTLKPKTTTTSVTFNRLNKKLKKLIPKDYDKTSYYYILK